MAYRWETTDSIWLEHEDSGQFELGESRGLSRIDWQLQARSRLPDVAQLLGASLPAACAHSSIYPEGFAFCPQCGAALRRPAEPHGAAAHLPSWWGPTSAPLPVDEAPLPKHAPHGLPLTALPLAAGLETRPAEPAVGKAELTIPAPPNAVCVFAAGYFGFAAQRLLALAYSRNVLQYWDPRAARWHLMTPEPDAADLSFTASEYAWLPPERPGAGVRGKVATVPTAQGLFRLIINPVSETYRTEAVFQQPLASAPGRVGARTGCLFMAADGVRLWTAAADGTDPEVRQCVDPDGAASTVPAAGWSRPFSYDGKLMWLHPQGQLAWQPGADPLWLPWPAGWTPRLQFGGPVRSRDGRLWQIGHEGQVYSFRSLGVAQSQVEPLDGARLGFGTLLFRRGHQVKNEPWDVEHVEDQGRDNVLVLPLLENVSSTRSQPTGLVLRLEKFVGKAEAALDEAVIPRTLIEWVGQRNVILDEVARLSQPRECQPFVYDNCLWLHHPAWNHIRGWHLKALP